MVTILAGALGGAIGVAAAAKGYQRLTLSRAKHPSLMGHVRMAKRIAGQIPFYQYGEDRFFAADGAPAEVAAQRRAGFDRLAAIYAERFGKSVAMTKAARTRLSDLQFTGSYRVPFQFAAHVRAHLGTGSFLERSEGPIVHDLDGNALIDLTGSYGVNLFGYDFYKETIREGAEMVEALGPVLGSYHPVVLDNAERLAKISKLDEISFHMSGTEAVMQAVRLARYHTKRRRLVRFCGAYHGWWGDVQPGIGNPTPADNTLTLADMSDKTLKVLATRKDIACVLVNPLQALHPNGGAPSDNSMVDSSRKAGFDKAAYGDFLRRLAATCKKAGIVLIFDEVFVGFRLAPGGAAEYFGVEPDMITYGKTLGGGLPVGVLCGRADLMKRWRDDRPVDICFARGTFNSHPYVMGAMNAFLRRLDTPEVTAVYDGLDERFDARAAKLNAALAAEGLPVEVKTLSTIWTVLYTVPSRYNWMLQYYLRAEGLALSWVGSGRLILSLDIGEDLFDDIVRRFVAAAKAMRDDGWWWQGDGVTNKLLRRGVLRETLKARFGKKG
ncbi:aminotransferase class III-fold pyridoxal phosphate-dependent enzyme [Sphingomonas montanisoli]|uniref:Aminotransferase class III-fold pyridoxal phosphate-dependent enzyme n=1 Tax=Sphingomonas montanisoli TaxID=2606412 RepID=A0A5D9C6Q3_9SPHN|nr:aminotransferase class III-fold pyridoxal phosphate-dependent enzyme [Sphingomonas montanisoli]TZG27528.1 aminotransferase class III-fold pyridoxal phosphate-dependent enzyme [Sphingomonas montanisoli]